MFFTKSVLCFPACSSSLQNIYMSTSNSLRSTYHTAWHQKQPVTICKQVSWNPTIPIPSVSKVKDSEGLGPVGSIDRSIRLRSGRTCEQEHVSLSNAFLRPRWIWDAEALYYPYSIRACVKTYNIRLLGCNYRTIRFIN